MRLTLQNPFPADNFSKYKMNVIPNKECILIIHKLELNNRIALVNITPYLANSAEDESDLI